jgi:hypothetical protein
VVTVAAPARPDDATEAAPGRRRAVFVAIGLVVVAAALLAPLWSELHKVNATQEDGFMLVVPDLVLDGRVPHADISWLYGPGSAWLPALVFALLGTSLHAAQALGLAYQVAAVAAVFAAGWRWGAATATGASLVAVLFVTGKGLTLLPWSAVLPFALATVVLGAWAVERRARLPAALFGLAASLALLIRPDVAVGVLGAAAVLVWPLPATLRKAAAVGFAAGLVPWVVHLAMAGPGAVFHGLVVDPLQLRAGNALPVPPPTDRVAGFIEFFINLGSPYWPFAKAGYATQLRIWFFLTILAVVLVVAVGAVAVRRSGTVRARLLLALGVLGAGFLPTLLQRADASHLNNLGPVVFPAAVLALAELAGARRRLTRGLVGAGAAAHVLLLVTALVPSWTTVTYTDDVLVSVGQRQSMGVPLRHRGRTFNVARARRGAVRATLETVERVSRPGDRLFVGPRDLRRTPYNDTFLYYLLPQLDPATRFIYMNPAVALHESDQLADDVASADVLVLSDQWSRWNEPNDSVRYGSDRANRVVRDEFCEVAPIDDEIVPPEQVQVFTVYRRCRA